MPPRFVRVKDADTGSEYTTAMPVEGEVILDDKPAVNRDGWPLPAKPKAAGYRQTETHKETT